MNPDPRVRRRRAGAIAAISGGGAASAIGISRHAGASGADAILWQDIGLAVAVVLIAAAVAVMAVASRRPRC